MPFTFKLSKRLALMKATLAVSATLVLACDIPDPAAPRAPIHSPIRVATSDLMSAGLWANSGIPSQSGSFEVQFDATPGSASMAGVVGLSNGPAADYTALAASVAFEATGVIDARNGGTYAASAVIPYRAGTTYHFRLDVNIPAHTYTALNQSGPRRHRGQ
jgi:hypothetical protein